jgi:predicted dienelactone hydrolase
MSGVGLTGALGITGGMGYSGHSSAQVRNEAKEAKDTIKPSDPPVATIVNPKTGRAIKLRIRLPALVAPTGLILYSPGLGSGISNGQAWCEAWRQAGYLVVTLAHPVTDDSIWRTSDKQSFKTNMQLALAGPQYGLRVSDCSFVLDHCLKSVELAPYIDPTRVGLAGHSYGALTAQTIAGQPLGTNSMRDPRIKAVIAFSPGATSLERARSMSQVPIPFFCITGDHDQFVTFKKDGEAIKLGVSLANREWIYANLPVGKKLQLKLRDADHMSFAGEPIDALHFSRDIKVTESGHQALWGRVSQMTIAFWEYYLVAPGHSVPSTSEAFETRLRAMLSPGDELKFG